MWLAVCEPIAPQNVWERFMERLSEEDEKCQTVMVCNKCYQNKNWCGFKTFDVGKYPTHLLQIQEGLHQKIAPLNMLEEMILSYRILCYKLVKLEHKGKGLTGCAINLKSTLQSDLKAKLPRKDAMKYIAASLVGEKVNKKEALKYTAYVKSKELLGLRASIAKLKLFIPLVPPKYRAENPTWYQSGQEDDVYMEYPDDDITNDTSIV